MSNVLSQPPPQMESRLPSPVVERRPRLWPGVVIMAVMWVACTVPNLLSPGSIMGFQARFFSPMIAAPLVFLWWIAFSRTGWRDRVFVPLALIAITVATALLVHQNYQMGLVLFGLPWALTLWVGWLLATPFLTWPVRRLGLLACILLLGAYCTLIRVDGTTGEFDATVNWRWTPTPEDIFLASRSSAPPLTAATPAVLTLTPGDWPEFRGPERDGHARGVRIATDWTESPPQARWRKRIGPGWSSFAVVGKNVYTQEQRGEKEVVVCYHTDSGEERWIHEDATRFTETVAGPGPRSTPTFHEGKLYTLGANGHLNCLDAATGKLIWKHDIAADAAAKVPMWAFSSSPLVAQGIVTVFAGGEKGIVLGYKADTGDLAWKAGEGKHSYCSTQLNKIDGVEQLLICTDVGLLSLQPKDGKLLWKHEWQLPQDMARVVQPARVGERDFLIGTGFDFGTRRIRVKPTAAGWNADEEVWSTRAIKPYYNDLVVHKGNLYGFDGAFFVCVNLDDGALRWKQRGFGHGQVLLLPDQDLLLILGEKGQAALVDAKPDGYKSHGQFQAIEGKTWNHPVIAHGKLFVRNGEEIACYQLKTLDAPKMIGD